MGIAVAAITTPASANHSWGGYHWARTANPFTLKVGDNVDGNWDPYLNTTISDWSKSTVVDMVKVAGSTKPRNCRGVTGTVQVCNAAYGFTGWLGIASISITGGTHITQGTTKLNDSYFNSATYNTPAWRNLVTCQEVGHTLGLDHQDENFDNANLGTCMDYTNNPSTNQHPNQHDYDELVTIYTHLDSFTTIAAGLPMQSMFREAGDTPKEWGRAIHYDSRGRPDVFERVEGPGMKTLTHVFWALDARPNLR